MKFITINPETQLPAPGTRVLLASKLDTNAAHYLAYVNGSNGFDIQGSWERIGNDKTNFASYAILEAAEPTDPIEAGPVITEAKDCLHLAARVLSALSHTITGDEGKQIYQLADRCNKAGLDLPI